MLMRCRQRQGLAGGIIVMLENGHIIDTLLYGMARAMEGTGRVGQGGAHHPHHGALCGSAGDFAADHGAGLPVRGRHHQHDHAGFRCADRLPRGGADSLFLVDEMDLQMDPLPAAHRVPAAAAHALYPDGGILKRRGETGARGGDAFDASLQLQGEMDGQPV